MQRRRDHGEREDAMRRIWAIPERDRLAIYESLRAYLTQDGAPETDSGRQVRLRAEALEGHATCSRISRAPGRRGAYGAARPPWPGSRKPGAVPRAGSPK